MAIFSSITGFLNRHRNKFFIGGIIIGGSVVLTKYAQKRLIEWQEKQARDFFQTTRKHHHFESTERTCNQTIINLVPTLNDSLSQCINTDELITTLRSDGRNLDLWNELKIQIFTKASCFIYTAVILVLTVRIQLNVLGGYLSKDATTIPTEAQERYLSLCNNLMGNGLEKMAAFIEKDFERIVGSIILQKQLKISDFESIFWAIQSAVASSTNNPIDKLNQYIIVDNKEDSSDVYNKLIRDTSDLLESDEVKTLANHCVNRGFAFFVDKLSEYYVPTEPKIKEIDPNTDINGFIHPSTVQIPLVKVIPILHGLVSKDNLLQFVSQLIANQKIKTLGANVYECFSC